MKNITFVLLLFLLSALCLQSQTKDTVYVVQKDTVYYVPMPSRNVDHVKAELGIALGTPSGLNLILAAHTTDVIFKISGAYLGHTLYGGQFDIGYKFSEYERTYHGVGLGFGFMEVLTNDGIYNDYEGYRVRNHWQYVSINYMLNTYGFYLNTGLSAGSGSFSNPQLMLQIGYAYQFR